MQPFSGNQRPDFLTCLMEMSPVFRLPRGIHVCRSSSNVPRLPWFINCCKTHKFSCKAAESIALAAKKPVERPKVVRTWCAFRILTSNKMCFAPQPRAIFDPSHPKRWLRTHRFSEPTFRPSGATMHGKNAERFGTFARRVIFFLLALSSLALSLL